MFGLQFFMVILHLAVQKESGWQIQMHESQLVSSQTKSRANYLKTNITNNHMPWCDPKQLSAVWCDPTRNSLIKVSLRWNDFRVLQT